MASDEGTGSETEHQTAIHLAVEVEVEVIESLLRVSELGLFFSSLQQSLATTSEFVGDEAGEEIDRRYGFGLSLAQASFEHGGDTSQAKLSQGTIQLIDGTRKETMELFISVPLLIIDDLGMRKLPVTAAEDLLEIVMRRYERASTLLTSNRPVDDWGKLLGDSAAVTAMLDRLLHHGHVLNCGPRSWGTKTDLPPQEASE